MYSTRFRVTGQRAFPLDMLRYDGCFPASQQDVHELDCSLSPEIRADDPAHVFEVTLVMNAPSKAAAQPTYERWYSFGWVVDRASVRSERRP